MSNLFVLFSTWVSHLDTVEHKPVFHEMKYSYGTGPSKSAAQRLLYDFQLSEIIEIEPNNKLCKGEKMKMS